MMTPVGAIVLGFGLGLRHATDADHVLIVSALLRRQCQPRRAALVAAWWGLGHSLSVLGVGLLLVLFEVRLPPRVAASAELLVAAMLIGFGCWHLLRRAPVECERSRANAVVPTVPTVPAVRALAVGAVHGLAGSAAVALLAGVALESRLLSVSYLLLFGLGTVCGMVLLTTLMARPLAWANGNGGLHARLTRTATATLSIGLGLYVVASFLLGSA